MIEHMHHGDLQGGSRSRAARWRLRRWLWALLAGAVLLTILGAVLLGKRSVLPELAGPLSGTPVAFSPDGQMLAAGVGDTIQMWAVQSGRLVRTLSDIHMQHVLALAFSPDGHTLAVGTDARQEYCTSNDKPPCLEGAILWDVQQGKVVSGSAFSYAETQTIVFSLAFSPDGHLLALGTLTGVEVWDLGNDSLLYTLDGDMAVAFSPDGQVLVSSSAESFSPDGSAPPSPSHIDFWDVASGRLLSSRVLPLGSSVTSLGVSPDGLTLASGGMDHAIRLWSMTTGTQLRILKGHSADVTSVAFSPDGRTLASGSWDATIKLWEVSSGTLAQTLTGHVGGVQTVTFSPDGRTLAAGSIGTHAARTVELWDVATGNVARTLSG